MGWGLMAGLLCVFRLELPLKGTCTIMHSSACMRQARGAFLRLTAASSCLSRTTPFTEEKLHAVEVYLMEPFGVSVSTVSVSPQLLVYAC